MSVNAQEISAKILDVHGYVYVRKLDGTVRKVKAGHELEYGDTVLAQGSSATVVEIGNLGKLTLGHDLAVTLDEKLIEQLEAAQQSDSIGEAINFDALAQAIEGGANLEELLPETAAGEDTQASGSDEAASASGVRFEFTAARVEPQSGFETSAGQFNSFDQGVEITPVSEDFLLNANNAQPQTSGIATLVVNEDSPFASNLSSAFSDADSDQVLSFNIEGLPEGFSFDPITGQISGTPTNDQALNNGGLYTLTVTATDSSGASNSSISTTFQIQVNNVNDAPTVGDEIDLGSIDEDSSIRIEADTFLQGAEDIDLDALSVSGVSLLQGSGELVANDDGSFSYIPDPNWNGDVVLAYQIIDGNGGMVQQIGRLRVAPINDLPIANDDGPFETAVNSSFSFNPLANDSDIDGDSLIVDSISAEHGTVIQLESGAFQYTPDDNYYGSDIISYQISDGNGGFAQAETTVNVIYNGGQLTINPYSGTDDATPTFSGTSANIEGDISLSINGEIYSIAPSADGSWTFTLPDGNALADGSYTVVASAEDAIGNSVEAQQPFVVDVYEPALTINDLVEVATATPTFSGTVANTDGPITLSVNGQSFSVTPNANGTWQFELPAEFALDDGQYTVSASASDAAGNNVNASDDFIVDVYLPQVTIVDLDVVATAQPTFSGTSSHTDGSFVLSVNGENHEVIPNADGTWQFTLPEGSALGDGSYTATIFVFDAQGNENSASDAFVVDAVDDMPIVDGVFTGVVTEGDLGDVATATGNISINDPDLAANPEFEDATVMGSYGQLNLVAGNWVYVLDQAAVQSLDAGDVVQDSLTLTASDGTQQVIVITINGTDDAAVISGVNSGAVAEANVGDLVQTTGSLIISDVDGDDTPTINDAVLSGSYGSLEIIGGDWTYTLDQNLVQNLDAGDLLVESIVVTASDGIEHTVTINISGTDDVAIISGVDTAIVSERDVGDLVQASGVLTISDVDADDAPTINDALINGTYGSLEIIDGAWTYTLDQTAVQGLDAGDSVTDAIVVSASDGTKHTVNITVLGTDDLAVISGTDSGSVLEGNLGDVAQASGTLSISDIDADDAPVIIDAVITGTYGSLEIISGAWTYTLDQSLVQELDAGDLIVDSIVVLASDGTEHTITINIAGSNDGSVIAGDITAGVSEANLGDLVQATGALTITDVDADDSPFINDASFSGSYGELEVVGGVWTYTLDQSLVQDLDQDQLVLDSFTVLASDGNSQEIIISITGTNDLPVISGDLSGIVSEGDVGDLAQITGTVAISDVDASDVPSFVDANLTGSYGSFVFAANSWTFTLDQASVQNLSLGESVTDTFTISADDGTTRNVVITIQGSDDAAIISGDISGTVTEGDLGDLAQVSGALSITDVDGGDSPTFDDASYTGSYGELNLSSGVWTYELNQSLVQSLSNGESTTDVINVLASDGSVQAITITINGSDDAPFVSGDFGATISEGNLGDLIQASGTISISDLDSLDLPSFSDTILNGTYGQLILVDGAWTYSLDEATVQTLAAGDSVNDVFTVAATDGTTQNITIQIDGENDAPVADSVLNIELSELDGVVSTSLISVISDVDAGDLLNFSSANYQSGDASGVSIVGNNVVVDTSAYSALESGESETIVYTYNVTDSSGASVTNSLNITINGARGAEAPLVSFGGLVPPLQGDDGAMELMDSSGLILQRYESIALNISDYSNAYFLEDVVASSTPSDSEIIFSVGDSGESDGHIALEQSELIYVGGLIYLEAGNEYEITGYRDDAFHIEIGGITLYDQWANHWGDFHADSDLLSDNSVSAIAETFSPSVSGYYTLEMSVYNVDWIGDFSAEISVNGGAPQDFSEFYIYNSLANLIAGGAQYGEFVGSGEGGFFPVLLNLGLVNSEIRLQGISAELATSDGSETLEVFLENIPVGVTVTDGVNSFTSSVLSDVVDVSVWDLDRLAVTPNTDFVGEFQIQVRATATETVSGDTASTIDQLTVTVLPETSFSAEDFTVYTNSSSTVTVDAEYLFSTFNLSEVIGADYSPSDQTLSFNSGFQYSLVSGFGMESNLATVSLDASGGEFVLDGTASDDVLVDSASGATVLRGYAGNDVLIGFEENESLEGGLGDDLLVGRGGNDTFIWTSQDDGSRDTIADFSLTGDTLDLADLLIDESSDALTLDAYLDFSFDGQDTTITIDTDGNGSAGVTQQIVLSGVDLSAIGNDQQIIQQLLDNGNLTTD